MKTQPSDAPALQFLQHNQEGLTLPVHQAATNPVSEDGRPTFCPALFLPAHLVDRTNHFFGEAMGVAGRSGGPLL